MVHRLLGWTFMGRMWAVLLFAACEPVDNSSSNVAQSRKVPSLTIASHDGGSVSTAGCTLAIWGMVSTARNGPSVSWDNEASGAYGAASLRPNYFLSELWYYEWHAVTRLVTGHNAVKVTATADSARVTELLDVFMTRSDAVRCGDTCCGEGEGCVGSTCCLPAGDGNGGCCPSERVCGSRCCGAGGTCADLPDGGGHCAPSCSANAECDAGACCALQARGGFTCSPPASSRGCLCDASRLCAEPACCARDARADGGATVCRTAMTPSWYVCDAP